MADTGARRVDRRDFHDNDPFAELTRIMGHDPRRVDGPSGPRGDEFGVDLEQELLGGLDLSEAEAGQDEPNALLAEEADHERLEADAPADAQYDSADAQYDPADAQYDDAAWSAIDRHGEELFADQAFANDFADDLDAAISADLASQMDGAPGEPHGAHAPATAVSDDEAAGAFGGEVARLAEQEAASTESPLASSSIQDMLGAETPNDELERADAARPEAFTNSHDWQEAEAGDDAEDDGWRSVALEEGVPADTAPGSAESENATDLAAFSQPETIAPHSRVEIEADFASGVPAEVDPAEPTQFAPGGHLSLEDELTALLADGPAESHESMWDAQPDRQEVVSGGDGEAHSPQTEQAAASLAEQQAYDPFAALADLAAARDEHQDPVAPSQEMPGWGADTGAPEIETVDIDDARPPQFGDLHIPDLPREEPVAPTSELDDLEAELDRAFEFMNSRNYADEPLADIPADLGQGWDEQQPSPDWAGVSGYPDEDENRWAGTALHAAEAGTAAAERVPGEADWYDPAAQQHHSPTDVAMTSEVPPPPRPAGPGLRRRGLMIAAAVAAMALIGGSGVFFMSSGMPGDGEPVLLRADAEPVRVRPEDPGGAVVPNQESQAYERVAGGGEEAEPTQQQLVDTTEEPIDLDAQGAAVTMPGVSDEEGDVEVTAVEAGDEPPIAAVKAEDRVEPTSETISSVSDDFVAVQPRRVRTMIVRPDGTMVPREETARASTSGVEDASRALSATSPELPAVPSSGEHQMQAALAPIVAPDDVASAGEQVQTETTVEPDAPAQETQASDTIPPVPGVPRSRPSGAASAAEPASTAPSGSTTQQDSPRQEQQVAAVDPAPAPTSSPAGEWSMQIASQPSAESAQVTYQDLARRYSSLLEGRGVNIVRAEIEGRGTYYRVRIPMDTRDEAINLCTRYKDAGGSCFVSR